MALVGNRYLWCDGLRKIGVLDEASRLTAGGWGGAGLFKRFSTHMWQNAWVNTVRHAILFLRLYNFIKGFVHIYVVFLVFLDDWFYAWVVQTFTTFNRTEVSLYKQVDNYRKKIVLFFYIYTV